MAHCPEKKEEKGQEVSKGLPKKVGPEKGLPQKLLVLKKGFHKRLLVLKKGFQKSHRVLQKGISKLYSSLFKKAKEPAETTRFSRKKCGGILVAEPTNLI